MLSKNIYYIYVRKHLAEMLLHSTRLHKSNAYPDKSSLKRKYVLNQKLSFGSYIYVCQEGGEGERVFCGVAEETDNLS